MSPRMRERPVASAKIAVDHASRPPRAGSDSSTSASIGTASVVAAASRGALRPAGPLVPEDLLPAMSLILKCAHVGRGTVTEVCQSAVPRGSHGAAAATIAGPALRALSHHAEH